jgi:outer membrane cobalamin receptor
VAASRLRGHEVSGAVTVGPVGVSANYTHLEARDLGEDLSIYEDNQLPGRPEDEVFARLDLGWTAPFGLPLGGGSAFYELNYVGSTFLDRANVDRVGTRLLHGVGLEVELPRRMRVGVEVRNLTDDQTRDVADFPLPGRAAFVTLSYGFGDDDR